MEGALLEAARGNGIAGSALRFAKPPLPVNDRALPRLLLLADGRFPSGGGVHSGGIESAVVAGEVTDAATLARFARGRLTTVGLCDAALAAATHHRLEGCDPHASRGLLAALDAEADARVPVQAVRTASRRLGRQLLRAASRCWPHPLLEETDEVLPDGAHQVVAAGAVTVAAALAERDAAVLVLHHLVMTCTQAAVRLLGLDPYEAARVTADLAALQTDVADEAVKSAAADLAGLPARSAPRSEIAAAAHGRRENRLFVT